MTGIIHQFLHRRAGRRNRNFLDRDDPLNTYTDTEIHKCFWLRWEDIIYTIVEWLSGDLTFPYDRKWSLSPEMQVVLAFWFYATGPFQNREGDTVNIDLHKSTFSRLIHPVSAASYRRARQFIILPRQKDANRQTYNWTQIQRNLMWMFIWRLSINDSQRTFDFGKHTVAKIKFLPVFALYRENWLWFQSTSPKQQVRILWNFMRIISRLGHANETGLNFDCIFGLVAMATKVIFCQSSPKPQVRIK